MAAYYMCLSCGSVPMCLVLHGWLLEMEPSAITEGQSCLREVAFCVTLLFLPHQDKVCNGEVEMAETVRAVCFTKMASYVEIHSRNSISRGYLYSGNECGLCKL